MRILSAGVALAAGFLAGLLIGRSMAPSKTLPASREAAPRTETASSPDTTTLAMRVAEKDEEIRRLTAIADAVPVKSVMAVKDPKERGKAIFDLFRRAVKRQDGRDFVMALGTLDELDESLTSAFVELYKALEPGDPMREVGLALILLSGGKDAAAFVTSKLSDPATTEAERGQVLQSIGTQSIFLTKRLPYDEGLARVTESLLASASASDRAGAAGLLAGAETDEARARLRAMAESDADQNVRAAAIGALGWNGDRTSYEYLKSYPRRQDAWAVNQALDRALKQLKERFAE